MSREGTNPFTELSAIIRQTFIVLKENPTLWILFFFIGILDFLALFSVFLSHSKPFAMIFAPLIRTFWDERYLHYPQNFLLLPKLYNHAHFLILTLAGLLITGVVIKKIEAHLSGTKISTLNAAGPVFKRYLALLTAWLLTYGFFVFGVRNILRLLSHSPGAQLALGFLLTLIIQAAFAFILPEVLLGRSGFLKNFIQGLVLGARHLFRTAGLILIPVFAIFVLSFLKSLSPVFVQYNPEIVLWVLAAGIVVSMITDLWVTSSTTLLFFKVRNR